MVVWIFSFLERVLFELLVVFSKENLLIYILHTLFVLFGAATFFVFFCCKDIIFGYESIGMKIMKLHIYDEKGNIVHDKKVLFKRSFYSSVRYMFHFSDFFLFDGERSYADKKMNTYVK